MITFTKEQLIASAHARIEFAEMMLAGELEPLKERTWSIELELARIALVSLEAEPVGYFYADKPGDWYQISDGDRVPSHRRIPLFANPQSSPVVKLPNEFISSEGIVVQIEKLMAVLAVHGIQYERRVNACRTAMQGKAESSESLSSIQTAPALDSLSNNAESPSSNSQVIPDGWVMVPVEPTEDMIVNGFESEPDESFSDEKEWEAYDAMSGCLQAAHRAKLCWAAMIAAAPDFREISNSSTKHFRENTETSTNCPCCGRKPLKNRTCSVAGCEGQHVAHGLCKKHYDIERKKDPSHRESIRAADKRYRSRKSAAPQQEVKGE